MSNHGRGEQRCANLAEIRGAVRVGRRRGPRFSHGLYPFLGQFFGHPHPCPRASIAAAPAKARNLRKAHAQEMRHRPSAVGRERPGHAAAGGAPPARSTQGRPTAARRRARGAEFRALQPAARSLSALGAAARKAPAAPLRKAL